MPAQIFQNHTIGVQQYKEGVEGKSGYWETQVYKIQKYLNNNDTYHFLFRERVLDVPKARWTGILEKNNVFILWEEKYSLHVYDWGRKNTILDLMTSEDHQLIGRPALEHKEEFNLMNVYYLSKDKENKKYANFIQFTDAPNL